jgi:hypothetical protein
VVTLSGNSPASPPSLSSLDQAANRSGAFDGGSRFLSPAMGLGESWCPLGVAGSGDGCAAAKTALSVCLGGTLIGVVADLVDECMNSVYRRSVELRFSSSFLSVASVCEDLCT